LVEIASPFPALIQGDARDINVHGQVVGFFSLGSSHKAFLWDDGEVLDLTTSLAGGTQLLKQAWGINDNGQIVVDNKLLTPCIAADSQCDGEVGIVDLLALLAVWGPCPGCPLDLDGDETVGIVDFLLMLAAWGPYVPG
jgi:probable HAF family extracellular repeat protein